MSCESQNLIPEENTNPSQKHKHFSQQLHHHSVMWILVEEVNLRNAYHSGYNVAATVVTHSFLLPSSVLPHGCIPFCFPSLLTSVFVLVKVSNAVITITQPKQRERGPVGLLSVKFLDYHSITGGSQGRISRLALKQKPLRNVTSWIAPPGLIGLLCYRTQDRLW